MNEALLKAENMKAYIIELISTEAKKQDTDRLGRSSLVILSDYIETLPPDNKIRNNFEWTIQQIAHNLSTLNEKQIANLLKLISFSHVNKSVFQDNFIAAIQKWGKSQTNIKEKAMLLRFLVSLDYHFTPIQIEHEYEIKQNYPWIWIDLMAPINWNAALPAIQVQLRKEKDIKPVLGRLKTWWNIRATELINDIGTNLVDYIDPNDLPKVIHWFKASGFDQKEIDRIFSPIAECKEDNSLFDSIMRALEDRYQYSNMLAA
jgi:hypothetical protein